MAGLIDSNTGLKFGTGLQFQKQLGTAGLDIVTFSPKNIAGLQLWFDGSDASTITLGTPPAIATWANKSGNANNATQSTAANRPAQHSAAQNGLNSVQFVSANSQVFNLTTPISAASGYTAFGVGKRTATNVILVFLGASVTANAYAPAWYSDSVIYSVGTTSRVNSTSEAVATFNMICAGQNASENIGFVRFNGTDITSNPSDNSTSSSMTSINQIGATASLGFSDGDIGEYLLYTAVLTLAQIQQVEAYLKSKWATP